MGQDSEAIGLLFGGMAKLGPGDDQHTRRVLRMLPERGFQTVVDVGCGAGRQTLALARELGGLVHAVDLHQPFLDELARRAESEGLSHLVRTHCLDMRDLAASFRAIDLLWSEGAAYNLGFTAALRAWAPALRPGGLAVISECSWLTDDRPERAREFWAAAYPGMTSIDQNLDAAERSGFKAIGTHILPKDAWIEGYYEVLHPRASQLVDHADATVRAFAQDTLREIELFQVAGEAYGYVFYLLERS